MKLTKFVSVACAFALAMGVSAFGGAVINVPSSVSSVESAYAAQVVNITYHLNGGRNGSGNRVQYVVGDPMVLSDPTRFAYIFDGWYTTSNFKEGTRVTVIDASVVGTKTTLDLYAKWTLHTCVFESGITKATFGKNGSTYEICTICNKKKNETTIYGVKEVRLSSKEFTWNGSPIAPTVTVVNTKGKTISANEYDLILDDDRDRAAGHSVIVRFKEDSNWTGEQKQQYYVIPAVPSIPELVAGKGKATVKKWKDCGTDSYIVRLYRCNKAGTTLYNDTEIAKSLKNGPKKVVFTGLKKGKYYRVELVCCTAYRNTFSKSYVVRVK